jgi:signal transduction histidine kinase
MPTPGPDQLAVARRLSAAVLAVSGQTAVPDVLQTIVDTARELVGAEYAALGVPDGGGSFAQFLVSGLSTEEQAAIGELPRQHGLLALMLNEPGPQRVPDIRERGSAWWPAAHPEMVEFLGVPIRDGDGTTLGAIFAANKAGGFTDADVELLVVLAAHAAIALTHARLWARSRELTIADERARIAHDLHDAVAQRLFGLRLTVRAADKLLDRDPVSARERLGEVAELAQQATEELHAAVQELRPASLDEDGLATTLRKQVEVLDRAHRSANGPRLTYRQDDPPELPPAQQSVVLRVAQEALHNAVRHASARTVDVRLCRDGAGGVRLEVADDGRGFDPLAQLAGGGLRSMRERAGSVRGTATVVSAPGHGTTVRLEVPGGRV